MQEGYVWPCVDHKRKGTKHMLTDSVTLNFARGLMKDPARVQTKFLKMLFEHSWGAPVMSGTREVFIRRLPYGGTQEIPVKVVRSHIVKHGASDNVAASGAPQPASMQMEKHKNKVAFRIYQAKEALEMAEYRQLLNAPPGLRRTDRTFSQLDVFLAVKKELSRANFHHAKEVLWASGGVGVPTTPHVYTHHSSCVYTPLSCVYTPLLMCIHTTLMCIHTTPHVYTHHSSCVYTPL